MFERLEEMKLRSQKIAEELAEPGIAADQSRFKALTKELASLSDVVEAYDEYTKIRNDLAELFALSEKDEDFRALAKDEIAELKARLEETEQKLKILLLPRDPNDDNNVVMEIRAGAGGDEAGLFGAELARMYKYYAESNRWKVEDLSSNVTELGGVKEMVFLIQGKGAYRKLKYESGVHRVQRVPATESQGRIHTSTVTVAVLPEVEDVEVNILDKDLKIDTFRSGGAGGQHVNKTESAIRITHLPTGIVVICEDERSQIKNREKAMKVLKSRLYDFYQTQKDKEYSETRRTQVGTGDRSERIRTYNFPQGRVTDHRIGLSLYSLDKFMEGDIEELLEALLLYEQTERLKATN
ncbi:MAG TPA: peptide chain release factor 1 [Eubacteriales bacterium]|jgi:peptide chain release factor 1|nr:peptide chain release factor 1 [Eubacteriales bacterium]HRU84712.1 peptide chain release factor 1 [Eubacteriales bacterium]